MNSRPLIAHTLSCVSYTLFSIKYLRPKPENYTRILKTEISSEEMRKNKHSIPVNGVIFSTREHAYDFENEASFQINHQNPKPAALIHHPKNNEKFKKTRQ